MLEHSPDQETESAPSVPRLPPPVGRFPSFRVNMFSFVVSKGMCPWLSEFQLPRGRGMGQGPSTETARGVSRLIPLLWLPGGPTSPGGRLPTSGADRALSLLYVSIQLSQPAPDCAAFLVTTVQRPRGQKRLDLPWCFAIFSELESAPHSASAGAGARCTAPSLQGRAGSVIICWGCRDNRPETWWLTRHTFTSHSSVV